MAYFSLLPVFLVKLSVKQAVSWLVKGQDTPEFGAFLLKPGGSADGKDRENNRPWRYYSDDIYYFSFVLIVDECMEPIDPVLYLILALLIVAWCSLHSTMIAQPVTEYLQRRLGRKFRFYRLFFNIIAILTLIPVVIFAYSLRTPPVFQWQGAMQLLRVLFLGTAIFLFLLGARRYDARQFFGIEQIKQGTSSKAIASSGGLDTSGILSVIRHPWYLAGILLIWARPLDISAIVVNVILTSYFIIGGYLEERKLVREFGEQYRDYQKRVSMLIPYKWLQSTIRNRISNR